MFGGIEDWIGGLSADTALALNCAVNTLVGGVAGLFIRELYRVSAPNSQTARTLGICSRF